MMKFLVTVAVLLLAYQVCTEEADTEDERRANCRYLNNVRANLTACCQYPLLVLWQWQLDICVETCSDGSLTTDRCCVLICALNALTVLSSIDEPSDVNWKGLVFSFLLSVGNDTQWTPVVESSVQRCYNQFSEKNNGYDCDVIPFNLYLIADCAYFENYLKCPKWNPHGFEECTYTNEYITKCID